MTPHDKLIAAMSIIQADILARDSACIPDKMFPTRYFETSALELAERMLADILPEIEQLDAVDRGAVS